MDTTTITLIVAVVLALIAGAALGMAIGNRQRTKRLQEKFGPEYEHAMSEFGDRSRAEQELQSRIDHVKNLVIRPLTQDEIDRFSREWRAAQADFVDDPADAIRNSDLLIGEVMRVKGYPVEDFEQGAADISVSYPELVTDYRGLHSMAVKSDKENIATEQLRQAMLHGRDLFENLISDNTNRRDEDRSTVAGAVDGEVVEESEEREKVT